MCYLLISETQEAFFGERKVCKVGIDSAREGHTQIHLDFDVLGMDCTEFGFDVTDKMDMIFVKGGEFTITNALRFVTSILRGYPSLFSAIYT